MEGAKRVHVTVGRWGGGGGGRGGGWATSGGWGERVNVTVACGVREGHLWTGLLIVLSTLPLIWDQNVRFAQSCPLVHPFVSRSQLPVEANYSYGDTHTGTEQHSNAHSTYRLIYTQ